MTLGIALLGTGNIAQRAFVPAVQAVDGAHLVAVLSRQVRGPYSPSNMAFPKYMTTLEPCYRARGLMP